MPFDKQQLTHFHAACTDSPRAACSAISRYVRQELEEAERRIARYQEAFESGDMPAKQAADRVQELMNRKAELEDTLRKVVPIRPPPYLYTASTLVRARSVSRTSSNLRRFGKPPMRSAAEVDALSKGVMGQNRNN